MIVYVVFTVARQVEGEYVFVVTDKGSVDRQKAEAIRDELKKQYVDSSGKFKVVRVTTPNGTADCYCEVGVHDVEIVDLPDNKPNDTGGQ